ncbi:hypothetical protein Cabys_1551 [Caldithrix abyssi DSM 13497]|uniref:Uncharacterized protein n=1 Tax=Caldithrix abyssi DSM 13497 TaxID=880073 RepID=A0A1J1C7C5_CALAY|nr:hypothetical protein Cabys_1551 [Caldithrix abyssi DSM 13497]
MVEWLNGHRPVIPIPVADEGVIVQELNGSMKALMLYIV